MNFIYPLSRYIKITQVYWASHLGVDFGWNDGIYSHQPILAIEDGYVVACADGYANTYPSQRIYGNYVNIRHDDQWCSLYGHLLKGLTVKMGQKVRKGEVIGYMGNSGYSNGQHLHFELRRGQNVKRDSIDPMDYLFIEDKGIYVNPDSKDLSRIRYRQTTVGTPVGRDPSVKQLEVIASSLNGRRKPSLQGERLGYVTQGFYDIRNTASADGFTWAEIEKDLWCATKEGDWTVTYEKEGSKMFSVFFPSVSSGDKATLERLADQLTLDVVVKQI